MSRLDRRPSPNPGDLLGGYQLLVPVGVGGMGQVWAAHRLDSPELGLVALKTALEHLANDDDFERIFVDEARIASRVVHPNVCAIHEFGSDGGISYLAMQWVNGGTLHDILTATPTHRIDSYLAASIAASVCAGLHAAHELLDGEGHPLHVIHRDVSPQNILISVDGDVVISDFGIARAKGQSHTPTKTGQLKGKLSYMAPEQLTGKEFDRRVDIFALGCVLYQATTGQRPFQGDDTLETMYRLLETDYPRPSTLVPDYPMRLESIVLTALAKDAAERYQSAAEFEDDLRRFLAARGKLSTRAEIAELVDRTLGSAIRQRTEELEQARHALSQSRTGSSDGMAIPSHAGANRVAWVFTALGAAVVSVTGAALLSHRAQDLGQHQPAARSKSAESTSPDQIEIEITTEPPNGWLRVDDGTVLPSPWKVVARSSPAVHVIVAGKDGYMEERRAITFERSTKLPIRLRPIASPREVASSTAPIHRANATPLGSAATSKSTAEPTESPTTRPRKPKRPLDPENPY